MQLVLLKRKKKSIFNFSFTGDKKERAHTLHYIKKHKKRGRHLFTALIRQSSALKFLHTCLHRVMCEIEISHHCCCIFSSHSSDLRPVFSQRWFHLSEAFSEKTKFEDVTWRTVCFWHIMDLKTMKGIFIWKINSCYSTVRENDGDIQWSHLRKKHVTPHINNKTELFFPLL